MKAKILSCLALFGTLNAQEETPVQHVPVEQKFGYVDFGVGPLPIPLPIFGIGHRVQKDHHGFDTSIRMSTVIVATALQPNLLYHYYFKPNLSSQFYLGAGISPIVGFTDYKTVFLISPTLTFGKQYRNENNDLRFFELQINVPTVKIDHNPDVAGFPIVTLSYGLGF